MEKTFDALQAGDFVADMHDGIAPIRKRFGVVSHIQWRQEDGERSAFCHWVTYTRRPDANGWFPFPNKELRVLGIQSDGSMVCGYNYDGMFAGIVIIAPYVTGSDPRD